jgi:hypothetical protein
MSENVSKSGAKTQHYIAELYFFIQGNLVDNQTPRTVRVDRMKALSDAVIDTYLSENSYITLSFKRSHEDVYNFNDAGFDGVRVILEFDYVDTCISLSTTTGENILAGWEPESHEWGLWNNGSIDRYTHVFLSDDPDPVVAQAYWYIPEESLEVNAYYLFEATIVRFNENSTVRIEVFDQGEVIDVSANTISFRARFTTLGAQGIYIDPRSETTGAANDFFGIISNPTLKKIA